MLSLLHRSQPSMRDSSLRDSVRGSWSTWPLTTSLAGGKRAALRSFFRCSAANFFWEACRLLRTACSTSRCGRTWAPPRCLFCATTWSGPFFNGMRSATRAPKYPCPLSLVLPCPQICRGLRCFSSFHIGTVCLEEGLLRLCTPAPEDGSHECCFFSGSGS